LTEPGKKGRVGFISNKKVAGWKDSNYGVGGSAEKKGFGGGWGIVGL